MKKCHFWQYGYCAILSYTKCTGSKDGCTFRKTTEQYITERDNAIRLCRKKGLCAKCIYRPFGKCELSEEV